MKSELHEKILITRRLPLNRKRLFKHYEAPIYIGIICLVVLLISLKNISKINFQFEKSIILATFLLFSFPIMGIATLINQYRMLRLKEMQTGLSGRENYDLTKKTLETLKWKIKIDTKKFVEANNPFGDIRTWGNEMISIVITNNKILINSICNVDITRSQAGLSFGKNKQNIRKFIRTFEIVKIDINKSTV